MNTITLWTHTMPLSITFSPKRKRSLSMQIKQEWIIIRAPKRMTQQFIDSFIQQKEERIIKHWEKQLTLQEKKKVYTSWSPVSLFWEEYPVVIYLTEKKRPKISFDDRTCLIQLPESLSPDLREETITKIIEKHLKSEAKKLLPLRTYEYATELWLRVDNVIIKTYRRKYGQCKWYDISYDWRIIQFPESVIDHIILHELTHIIHKHHKKSFRDALKSYDPWFDHNLKRLKDNGAVIHCS